MQKATRQHTKKHNEQLVLQTIYQSTGISRAEIARMTHLTRPTVSSIVSELMEKDYVLETGIGPSVGGKPPTLLNINKDAHQIVAVDLGSQEFRGAVVNLGGDILHRIRVPLNNLQGEDALAKVYSLVDLLLAKANAPVIGIGVGTPGMTNPVSGVIQQAVNLNWKQLHLKSLLEERYRKAVVVANDSHMAALGEYTFGARRKSKNLILMKIGKGIGAGIVINGSLYVGDGFGAGEIGHVVVVENGPLCTCGNNGCLETVASTIALMRHARESIHRHFETSFYYPDPLSWETLFQSVRKNDEFAKELLQPAGKNLGIAIAGLIGSFNIHRVVIAGRVAQFGRMLLEYIWEEASRRVLPALTEKTEIHYATAGTDIVILGSSAILLKQELGVI